VSVRSLPRSCSCCGREFTVADVAKQAGVSPATVRKYLSGELLYGDSPTDRYSRLVDKVVDAVAALNR
jgi:DNA-binding LacI/PurR family transcriptional regulator